MCCCLLLLLCVELEAVGDDESIERVQAESEAVMQDRHAGSESVVGRSSSHTEVVSSERPDAATTMVAKRESHRQSFVSTVSVGQLLILIAFPYH